MDTAQETQPTPRAFSVRCRKANGKVSKIERQVTAAADNFE